MTLLDQEVERLTQERDEARSMWRAFQERCATHRCKVCQALWIKYAPGEVLEGDSGSWSLASEKCGPCCDNVAMGEQIEAIGLTAALAEAKEQLRLANIDAVLETAEVDALEARLEVLEQWYRETLEAHTNPTSAGA